MRLVLDRKCLSNPTAAVGRCPQQPPQCQLRGCTTPQIQISCSRTLIAVRAEQKGHALLSARALSGKQSEQSVEGGCDPDDY